MADTYTFKEIQAREAIKGKRARDKEVFDALSATHPSYKENEESWQRIRDVMGDEEVNKGKYLPANSMEPADQYEYRRDISEWIPESPLPIGRYVSALYQTKPKRKIPVDLNEFVEDADMKGSSFDDSMSRVMHQIMSYGTIRCLINSRLPTDATDVVTRAQEKSERLRPYLILYNPLSVIDWDADDFGVLTMCRIKEALTRKRNPLDPMSPNVKVVRFLHYDRVKVVWWVFEGEKEEMELVETGERPHGLNAVPLVSYCWPREIKTLIGASYIRYMVKADIQKFRADSDLSYDSYLHAHPLFKIWSTKELSEVGIGSSNYVHLHPGDGGTQREDAGYAEAPLGAFDALRMIIGEKQATIMRHASTDPMGTYEPVVSAASGISRAWSFGTSEARMLSSLADAAVDIECMIFNMVMRYMSDRDLAIDAKPFEEAGGEIQYPEEFDLSATSTLLDEAERSANIINSPTFLRTLHKRIVSSKMGDAPQDLIQKAFKEIDDNPLIGTSAGKMEGEVLRMPTSVEASGEEEEEGEEGNKENREEDRLMRNMGSRKKAKT